MLLLLLLSKLCNRGNPFRVARTTSIVGDVLIDFRLEQLTLVGLVCSSPGEMTGNLGKLGG